MAEKVFTAWDMALKKVKPLTNDEDLKDLANLNDFDDRISDILFFGMKHGCFNGEQAKVFELYATVYPNADDPNNTCLDDDKLSELMDAMGLTTEAYRNILEEGKMEKVDERLRLTDEQKEAWDYFKSAINKCKEANVGISYMDADGIFIACNGTDVEQVLNEDDESDDKTIEVNLYNLPSIEAPLAFLTWGEDNIRLRMK